MVQRARRHPEIVGVHSSCPLQAIGEDVTHQPSDRVEGDGKEVGAARAALSDSSGHGELTPLGACMFNIRPDSFLILRRKFIKTSGRPARCRTRKKHLW